jgi:hypothetical protein
MSKSRKITFRAEENLYKFIEMFSRKNGMERSELIRNILVYFQLGFLIGEFNQPFNELEKKFLKKFGSKRARKQFVSKKDKWDLKKVMGEV